MRIKHWQGYGSVNAKRNSAKTNPDGTKTLVVTVTGMHECGLARNDAYDVHRWLVTKFVKDCPDYQLITGLTIHENPGEAVYRITYRPAA